MARDPQRRDVIRAAEDIGAALGEDATWASLNALAAAEAIWRHVHARFAGKSPPSRRPATRRGRPRVNRRRRARAGRTGPAATDGATWARRTVQTFFAAAEWLRARGHIPEAACLRPERWQADFRADWWKLTGRDVDDEAEAPRFTPDEAGRLLDALFDERIDPRLRLTLLLGGDSLRAGQVRRCLRSDLDLGPCGAFGLGRLRVRGRGRKRGSIVDLDPAVREAIERETTTGYLRDLEAAYRAGEIADYALMPQGRFVDGRTPVRAGGRHLEPVSKRTLLDYFHELEDVAGVSHVPGRGWYGLRRLWADLTPDHVGGTRAREVMGGWARGSEVADRVYRTKEDEAAIREAARGRAAIREALLGRGLSEVSELRSAALQALAGATDAEVLRSVLEALGVDGGRAREGAGEGSET